VIEGGVNGEGSETGPWNDPPLVVASYDTEFLGHGWKEGMYWLELTLRSLAASDTVRLMLPSAFLRENAERGRADLLETTWGTGRDHSTWVVPETAWMWDDLGAAQHRLRGLLSLVESRKLSPLELRALEQAAREVLLLESSDWPYMVAKDRARDYAIERFRSHLARFEMLAEALENAEVESIVAALSGVEEADNIFAELDLGVVSGHGGAEGSGGR